MRNPRDGETTGTRRGEHSRVLGVLGAIARVTATVTAAAAAVLFAVVAVGYLTDAWRVVPVRTGSMAPAVPAGSAAIATRVDQHDLREGDVIIFHAPTEGKPLTVHRIVEIEERDGERYFETKGDANNGKDPWLVALTDDEVWRVRHGIPVVGRVVSLFTSPRTRFVTLVLGAAIVLLVGLRRIWRSAPGDGERPRPGGDESEREDGDRDRDGVVFARTLVVGLAIVGLLGGALPSALATFTAGASASAPYSTGLLADPSPLTCQWMDANQVRLDWTNGSPTFTTGYQVDRSDTTGGPYSNIATPAPDSTTTYTDSPPAPKTTPRYYVARSARSPTAWTSADSNEVDSPSCVQAINAYSGTGVAGATGDGGAATAATMRAPRQMAYDSDTGAVYIADTGNHRIRKVTAGGTISTVAGTGRAGFLGDGGAATAARLRSPRAVAFDTSTDTLYIADTSNNRIRMVDSGGTISTIIGGGATTVCAYSGAGSGVSMLAPSGVELAGGVLYVSDTARACVRQYSGGTVSQFAGTGTAGFSGDGGAATSAQLRNPSGLAVSGGTVYIADMTNNRVRVVSGGTINTAVGGGATGACTFSGAAGAVSLSAPDDVAVDGSGRLFVADTGRRCVRKVVAGTVSRVAFTGTSGSTGDGGPAFGALIRAPGGVEVQGDGSVLVSDRNRTSGVGANNRVRRVVGPIP